MMGYAFASFFGFEGPVSDSSSGKASAFRAENMQLQEVSYKQVLALRHYRYKVRLPPFLVLLMVRFF